MQVHVHVHVHDTFGMILLARARLPALKAVFK